MWEKNKFIEPYTWAKLKTIETAMYFNIQDLLTIYTYQIDKINVRQNIIHGLAVAKAENTNLRQTFSNKVVKVPSYIKF